MFFENADFSEPYKPTIPYEFLEEGENVEETEVSIDLGASGMRATRIFNFTGLSFKDYVKSFEERLNDEMKKIVKDFIMQK